MGIQIAIVWHFDLPLYLMAFKPYFRWTVQKAISLHQNSPI